MRFLTGVLNSRLVKFWLKNKGKMQGENYQLDKEPLEMIPLPLPNCPQKEIAEIVADIIEKKKGNQAADTSALESRIDALVYHLYGMTDEDIAIIESN